ncbi:type II secretion system protein GspK [Verrucomicrobium sp. BvORR034]|jgi:general secretion pathway protein K|uniref:general secretion pathway protein GspK n=1 Tax=Verrucomicrobium sp. BvORR034 TaxID=1396418 RepID=UPI0006799B78|nr:type II secretion system protein GspK [Verrucomicrobium sp. BvORR034]
MFRPSPSPYFPRRATGSALLVVLWVIALLSFLVVTTMMITMQDVETGISRKMVFRARQLAEMGVAVASHPMVKAQDPLLRRKVSDTESYHVRLTTEEARINLNSLLTEEKRPALQRVFTRWGLRPADASELVESLMDWKDADDLRRLQGAERQEYERAGFADRPYNRPFHTLDEVLLVKGMGAFADAHPEWREIFTLWGDGRVDVNEASAAVIAATADVSLSVAETVVAVRDGRDGEHQTEDDQLFENVEDALTLLGLGGEQRTAAAALFSLRGSTLRIESVGQVNDLSRGIAVILKKDPVRPKVLEWREFTVEPDHRR